MKSIFFFIGLTLSAITPVFSQNHTDGKLDESRNTFKLNDSISLSVADTVIIDIPATNDFLFVSQHKKSKLGLSKLKKIGDVGSAVGGALGSIGMATGSLGTLRTGLQVMNAGSVAQSVGMTSEAIENLNISNKAKKLIGMKVIVKEFLPPTGELDSFVKAIVVNAEKDKEQYEIKLSPAIYTGEIHVNVY